MTKAGFTLIEVLISVTLLSFIALVTFKSGNNARSIISKVDKRADFYNDLSLVMLGKLSNTKDSIYLDEHLRSIKTHDKVQKYLKTKKLYYTKEIVNKEGFIVLNSLKITDKHSSVMLYSFELGK